MIALAFGAKSVCHSGSYHYMTTQSYHAEPLDCQQSLWWNKTVTS